MATHVTDWLTNYMFATHMMLIIPIVGAVFVIIVTAIGISLKNYPFMDDES